MQDPTARISRKAGTLVVRPSSGRHRIKSHVFITGRRSRVSGELETLVVLFLLADGPRVASDEEVVVAAPCDLFLRTLGVSKCTTVAVVRSGSAAVLTVRALYAGTLVTSWTTAPSHPPCRSSPSLLAALCLFLATLTITTRCYASSSATHPLVQLNNPIKADSITHSSKIVLSRIFKGPRGAVQSDTRIIVTNSKVPLYNQTFNRRNFDVHHSRTKRQTTNLNQFHDDIDNNEIPRYPLTTDTALNLEKRSNVPTVGTNVSDSAWNISANVNGSEVIRRLPVVERKGEDSGEERETRVEGTQPMPPVIGHDADTSVSEWGVLVLVLSAVVLTVALGLVTCVLNHYRFGAGGTAAVDPHDAVQTPTTAPMLSVVSAGAAAGVGGMDRLRGRGAAARDLAASRDRQVRLHAVHTDIAIDLPPSIAMPDGEEHPFTSSRLHIRDSEQESEIYQKCIKPPPNRTVLESESPPPYRSSSAGLLGSIGSSSSSSSDWSGGTAPLVVRCHSMSSTSKRPEAGPSGQKTDFIQRTVKIFTGKKSQPPPAPTLPVVIVPARPRRTPPDQQQQNNSVTGRPKPSV